jgi:N-acetylmuramate 1-kinase
MTNNGIVDERLNKINLWLEKILLSTDFLIEPASSDASFRRYFRVTVKSETLILMDAPPGQEDMQPFISIASFMYGHGIHVPKISDYDMDAGFLLLSDFGYRSYLDVFNEQSTDQLYKAAIDSLISMQLLPADEISLPVYNRNLLDQEMSLFPEWFLNKHLSIDPPSFLDETFKLLTDNALEQFQVFVHRDYHSRNLMDTTKNSPGIIDFQDAVIGPVSYDLVSLLRDCYIEWPDDRVAGWIHYYFTKAQQKGLLIDISIDQFSRWFDLMGLQRHLKVLGIFARLNYRDNKPNYMNDLPLTLHYVQKISAKYPELRELNHFLDQPRIAAIL